MRKPIIFFSLAIALMMGMSCSDQIVSECSTDGLQVGVIQSVSFTEIQNQVLTPSCATTGCHGGNDPAEGLDLSQGKAYANLVNVASSQRPQLRRVLPGNSAQSYLVQKLRGQETSVMPPAGKLSSAIIDSIASWIDRGAANN